MRKLVLQMQVSLDGFVGLPDGGLDWVFPNLDAEYEEWGVDALWQAGVHLMGGMTGRDMVAHWPTSDEPYAPPMNEIPKVIFSRTLEDVDWAGARVERGDLVEEVNRLKSEPGKEILAHGGSRFAQALSQHGLIDEYRLIIHPVALGHGLPLFPERPEPLNLNLVESRTFGTGVAVHVYQRR